MLSPLSQTEKLLFTTVRIETTYGSGEMGSGTGFFYIHEYDEDKSIPFVVTNKHVVRGATRGVFRLHEADFSDSLTPTGHFVDVEIDDFEKRWFLHPDDSVDLCLMPFQPVKELASQKGKKIFHVLLDHSTIPKTKDLEELTAVEDILMIGYPNGLWDFSNNLPIVRRGITATHPAIDFCGRHEFVVDAACFPGSSGSPVFLYSSGSYMARNGDIKIGSRFFLLGILYAGPQMTVEGKLAPKSIPVTHVAAVETKLMIHLGYILKSIQISVAANEFIKQLK